MESPYCTFPHYEKNGLIILKVFFLVLPKMEYTLTKIGESLKQVYDAMLNKEKVINIKQLINEIIITIFYCNYINSICNKINYKD